MKYTLQQIDESLIDDHYYIEEDDECFFFGEYAGKQGYSFSETNQLIFNFKKPMSAKGKPGWTYKSKAIQTIAEILLSCTAWNSLKQYTWIPIPPSKVRTDSEHDDRLISVLKKLQIEEQSLDFRDILLTQKNRNPAHDPATQTRPTIQELFNNFDIANSLLLPKPRAIAIFDDVLNTGASFKAAKQKLCNAFPDVPIRGIFIARNIHIQIED
ncbi:TPA: hypothetical protein JBI56_06675 [Legionella pneumophila]|nr:hypothetical protein [Legionella pneumophila]